MENRSSFLGISLLMALSMLCFLGCQKQYTVISAIDEDNNSLIIQKAIDEVNEFLKSVEPAETRSYGQGRRVVSSWVKPLSSKKNWSSKIPLNS